MGNSLDAELKDKWDRVDSAGPVKTAGQMYVCRVPRSNGTAVHVWLQCYESGWKPTEKLRRLVGLEVFDRMLFNKSIEPAESVILLYKRFKKVYFTQIIHSKFPAPLVGKKDLLELWKTVTSLPLSPITQFLKIEVNTQTERLHHIHMFLSTVPVYVAEFLKTASTLKHPLIAPLVRYVTEEEYGDLAALKTKVQHRTCFNTFMEQFYASPALLERIREYASSKKTTDKQALHCHVDWETFVVSGFHVYILLPLRQTPLWGDMDNERLNSIREKKGLLLIVQIAFDRKTAFTSILGLDDNTPAALSTRPPLANYKFECLERPIKFICAQCSKDAVTMSRCMRCKAARYCSEECRDLHWKAGHNKVCKGIASLLGFPVDVIKA